MDYLAHYTKLIDRANRRPLPNIVEWHHIIPRCMGGSDDTQNLAALTPEEHFIAHLLLVIIHPDNTKLVCAAWFMAGHQKNNKQYGWLRRQFVSRQISAETRYKIGLSKVGKQYSLGLTRSEETKRKISAAKRGKPSYNKGVSMSEEQKAKLRKPKSEEHKQKLREAALRPETRARLSAINKGKVVSDEQKRKQSGQMKGRPSPRKGIPMSEESKRKLSETQRRRFSHRAV